MSDELERKRQEKIANFKLTFTEDENEQLPANDSPPVTEENNGETDSVGAETVQQADLQPIEDISSGEELNSFSSGTENDIKTVDKDSLKKAKKIDRKRRRKKAKKNRIVFRLVWITMVVLVSVMIGEFLMVGVNDLFGVGREAPEEESGAVKSASAEYVTITIPEDASIDDITDILYDNGIINVKWSFKLYAWMTKATTGFTKGTFKIDKSKDYQALINYMQSDMNRADVVTIRFTEGMSIRQYAKLLNDNKVCSEKDFLDACASDRFDEYEFIGNMSDPEKREYKLEGFLFPDTYDFYEGEKVDNVVEKFLANYRRKVYAKKKRILGYDKKMTVAERAETINMTMDEVLTLASLIQAEAADRDDMYMISAILHNRLATIPNGGINENGEGGLGYLQLDSTKYYPYLSLDDIPNDIRKTFKSKYNTYDIQGLPAGPICNPGLEAIEAALTVGETDYYYFCHKSATSEEPAVAYYAKTNEEHEANQKEAGLR